MSRVIPDACFDDTLVPNIFILESLQDLGLHALRIYLLALHSMGPNRQLNGTDLRKHFSLSEEDYKAAVCELIAKNLLTASQDFSNLQVTDLKRQMIDRYFSPVSTVSMAESVERVERNKDQEMLIRSVNESFFHGLMGPTWFQAIDEWFRAYRFEAAVVYQMFVDAKARDKLNGPQYLNKVAEDYHKNKIRTFADLGQYKEQYKNVRLIANQVGQKLRKTITEYDLEIIEKWVLEYQYDFQVIEVALRNAVRLSDPNLHYFDKILETWSQAGIRTAKEAENVEKNYAKQNAKTSGKYQNGKKKTAMQERAHDEDYYAQFYDFAVENEPSLTDKKEL